MPRCQALSNPLLGGRGGERNRISRVGFVFVFFFPPENHTHPKKLRNRLLVSYPPPISIFKDFLGGRGGGVDDEIDSRTGECELS